MSDFDLSRPALVRFERKEKMRIKVTAWMEMPVGVEYTEEELYEWLCDEFNKAGMTTEYSPKFGAFSADNIMYSFERKE